jgi:zinc D-Ala-D-Ala carboxypeptidase
MQLTKNFSLQEFTRTSRKVDNTPNEQETENIRLLCEKVLQPIRDKFGYVSITSGYRSPTLNRLIGGSASSEHCKGMAVDFKVEDMKGCFKWIQQNLEYRQLINEFNLSWIHISYNPKDLKKQVLYAVKEGGKTVYKTKI